VDQPGDHRDGGGDKQQQDEGDLDGYGGAARGGEDGGQIDC